MEIIKEKLAQITQLMNVEDKTQSYSKLKQKFSELGKKLFNLGRMI